MKKNALWIYIHGAFLLTSLNLIAFHLYQFRQSIYHSLIIHQNLFRQFTIGADMRMYFIYRISYFTCLVSGNCTFVFQRRCSVCINRFIHSSERESLNSLYTLEVLNNPLWGQRPPQMIRSIPWRRCVFLFLHNNRSFIFIDTSCINKKPLI